MGARGPRPKPLSLKLLAGNPGRRPLTDGAGVRFAPGVPSVPSHLGARARAVWRRVVKELDAAGVLAVADRDALAAYCCCVADVEELTRLIDAEGLMVEVPTVDRNGELTGDTVRKPHPALKWRSDLLLKVKQFAAEFGLTPASRSRVAGQASAPGDQSGNKVLQIRERIRAARENPAG